MGCRGAAPSSPRPLSEERGATSAPAPRTPAHPPQGAFGCGRRGEKAGGAKKLSTKDRKKLGKKSFALPDERKYPIPDKAHARNALARVAQDGTQKEQKEVRATVKRRFPGIGKKK